MSGLNPRQQAALLAIDGPVLVLAGAGSGKTRVITQKIAYLIQQCGYNPRHIAAVTFTNKAAREMKARVGKLLKGKESHGLRVSTFHTLGLEIIRREIQTLGYKPGFSIFDAADAMGLIKELGRREGTGDGEEEKQLQWQISHWKNAFVDPEQALREAVSDQATRAALLYAQYNRHLKAYNAVDFDDLIMLPVQLFEREPEILQQWQNRIRYLLVDEYQDTNATQYRLVQLLVGLSARFTVVGDDDQSIYAWRGAQPENLALLQRDFPGLKVIKLEQNYRSMGRILKAANQLIANNEHVFEKRLWSELGHGEPLRIIQAADDEDEAQRVVSEIIHHKFQHKADFGDFAILYRGNHQSRIFEKALREQRIPYTISGSTSFFSHTEVKDIMAYLRLVTNPDDDAAFLRVINTPRREIGPTTLEKLGGYAMNRGISLFTACFELGLAQHLPERAVERLRGFAEWLVDIAHRADKGDRMAAVRDLVHEIDYRNWLQDSSRDLKQAERRVQNIEELIEWIGRMHEQEGNDPPLTDLVAKLTLFDIMDRNDSDEGEGTVRLMTLHAAKGLEFPHVFLVGMEEELLPHRVSIEEENIAEERRLAYVGITRAQRTLTMTLAAKRRRGGEMVRCEPSRFLDELPPEDIQWEGKGVELDPDTRQARGKAHLANLRGLLGQ